MIHASPAWYLNPKTGQRATCPLCGNDRVFDNRSTKPKPTSPDLRCGTCKAVGWLNEGGSWRWATAK